MRQVAPIQVWSSGPYKLTMWNDVETSYDWSGKTRLRYQLEHDGETIFSGEDFRCSPMHAIDSAATVSALLSFLSLRPGDTDREYFDRYSPGQLNFAISHGEMLALFAFELENGDETGLEFPAEEYE